MAASSSSATVAVEKATSDLLMGPDWTMNIEICDSINSNYWQPKDVVKAVKKRLQHRSSKVQLLALTLLETMVKNCGDYVHFQIAERNILEEMIKIVRKKADMHVRDKILVLLDSWQEAFGGAGGKYPQYYWAYEELRRSGVVFPKRSPDAAPIFTPPPTHPTLRHMQAGYGMPSNSSKTLDETMATEIESLSLSSLDSMRQVVDLLSDMLQAVNPSDRAAVKDEVIIDLVDRCRTNQKKLMQMLTTTGDEELLGRGLELNDSIQSLLARHDAIASGTPFPIQGASSSTLSTEVHSSVNQTEIKSSSPVESVSTPKASPPVPVYSETRGHESDDEEEDEFAQLARRHSKTQSVASKDATTGSTENSVSMNTSSTTPHVPEPSTSVPSNALALPNPPPPVSTAKDQDIIDLLSITLSLAPSSPQTTFSSSASSQGMHQIPVPSRTEGYSYAPQTYPGNLAYNSYVVPWAQPQSRSEFQTQSQQQMYQSQPQSQSQSQPPTPPSSQQLQHTHYESEQALHHQQTQHLQSQPQSELLQSQPQPQSPHALQRQSHSQLQNQHLHYSPPQQQLQPHNEPQPLQYQPQHNPHLQPQPQPQHNPHLQPQPQHNPHLQPQPQHNPHLQPQPQPQHNPHLQPQPQTQHHPHLQPHPQSQPQPQPHLQPHPQPQPQPQSHLQSQPQAQPQLQSQSQLQSQPQPLHLQQSQPQPQFQNQHHQYPARYPPPPWAATPGYPNYQNHLSSTNPISTPQANTTASYTPATGVRPLQPNYSFSTPGISGTAVRGDPRGNSGPRNPANATGQKPFIPSYRLFEDLNVFGNTDGRMKMTGSGTSSSLSGTMGPGMVGGRK